MSDKTATHTYRDNVLIFVSLRLLTSLCETISILKLLVVVSVVKLVQTLAIGGAMYAVTFTSWHKTIH